MNPRTVSVDDVKRALAEQDRRLRAAYEGLEPGQRVAVATVSLQRLAEQCSVMRTRAASIAPVVPLDTNFVRC
jgi:hypothetical protein